MPKSLGATAQAARAVPVGSAAGRKRKTLPISPEMLAAIRAAMIAIPWVFTNRGGISVNQKPGDGKKDGGDDGDGNGDDQNDDDLAKAFDDLAIDICEYDRVWDKRLSGGEGAFRRCQKPKVDGSQFCKCHRDMLIRHAGLGIRQALPKPKPGTDQHRQRRK